MSSSTAMGSSPRLLGSDLTFAAPASPRQSQGTSWAAMDPTPSRQQKWLEQLCHVEARLLSNWQEFVEHRQDVQLRMQELTDTVQRMMSSDGPPSARHREVRLETEIDRCMKRVQQLSESHDDLAIRMGELRGNGDVCREAVESLRGRVQERLQEVAAAIEDSHRQSVENAKRTSRTVAEELLRKMQELNDKIGENMASMEEQSSWAMQRLRQEVGDVAAKVEGQSTTAEADLRGLEGRVEQSLRSRCGELQAQIHELSDHASRLSRESGSDSARLSRLESMHQEMNAHAEGWQSAVKQGAQAAERLKAQLEEVRSNAAEQLGRAREELTDLLGEQQRALRESLEANAVAAQERVRQLREELLLAVEEEGSRRDDRTEALRETLRGQEAELSSLQLAVNSLDARVEARLEQLTGAVASAREAVDAASEVAAKAQQTLRTDAASQLRAVCSRFEDDVEARTRELRTHAEAMVAELQGKAVSKLADLAEEVERLRARFGEEAARSQTVEAELRQRDDTMEQAWKHLREEHEQRTRSLALSLSEQMAQARESVAALCQEKFDQVGRTAQKLHESQESALAVAREDLQKRLDGVQASFAERLASANEQSTRLAQELHSQARAWFQEVEDQTGALNFRVETQSKERQQETEAQERRLREMKDEFAEKQAGALRGLEERQSSRADRLAKSCAELLEGFAKQTGEMSALRRELQCEIEAGRTAGQQQMEDVAGRLHARIEASVGSMNSQFSRELAEERTAARCASQEAFEKAEKSLVAHLQSYALRDQLDGCVVELKDFMARVQADGDAAHREWRAVGESVERELGQLQESLLVAKEAQKKAVEEAKDREAQILQRLAASSQESTTAAKDLDGQLRQLKDSIPVRLGELKTSMEDQLRRQQSSQSEQLVAAKASAAELVKQHSAVHNSLLAEQKKETSELARCTEQRAIERAAEGQRQVEERLSKALQAMKQDVVELRAEAQRSSQDAIEKAGLATLVHLQAYALRDHVDGCLAELKESQARAHAHHDSIQRDLRAADESVGRDVRQLQEALRGMKDTQAAHKDDAKERDGQLWARLAAVTQEHGEAHRGLEERLKSQLLEHKEGANQRLGEAKAMYSVLEEQIKRQHAATLEQVSEARAFAVEQVKQHSALHGTQLADHKKEHTEQLKTASASLEERTGQELRKAEERLARLIQSLGQEVGEARTQARSLGEQLKGHQEQTSASIQKSDERHQKAAWELTQAVADAHSLARSLGERLGNHQKYTEDAIVKLQQDHQAGLAEHAARQSATFTGQLTELRESLLESNRQAAEASNELTRQTKEVALEQTAGLRLKLEEQRRELETGLRTLEHSLIEHGRNEERHIQDLTHALQTRNAAGEARLDALRQEVDQHIASLSKKQAEEASALAARIQSCDIKATEERDRLGAATEAKIQQVQTANDRIVAAMTDFEAQMKRAVETNWASSVEVADQLRVAIRDTAAEAKTRQDEAGTKLLALASQLADVKSAASASVAASQQREEQIKAELDRRCRAAREDHERLEGKLGEASSAASRSLESLEQRLTTALSSACAALAPLDKLVETRAELQRLASQTEVKFEKVDERSKEQVQSLLDDAERRCKRQAEGLETLKKAATEQADAVRKRCSEVQQTLETALTQRLAETLASARASATEGQQRAAKEAAEGLKELRQRLDEAADRLAGEQRDSQQVLYGKVQDVQSEQQRQSASDKAAMQTLLDNTVKQAEERLRDALTAESRERMRVESQAQRQVEDAQRALQREASEIVQRLESASRAALEHESASLQKEVDDARRAATVAVQSLAESMDVRVRETAETAARTSAELSEQQRASAEELRLLVQTKAQCLEERVGGLGEHLGALEKDARSLAEELGVEKRRWASAHQAQSAAHEELKRIALERHAALQRKVQGDGEALVLLTQQVSSFQEDQRQKNKDLEGCLHAGVAANRKDWEADVQAVRDEIVNVHRALQGAHSELLQVFRSTKEKQGSNLTELSRQHDDFVGKMGRKLDELDMLTSQTRILSICGEQLDGLVRSVAAQELQIFQREALDSLEWKLERCVQWLHGANVKLGLNPQGTMFSTDRFREMLFDDTATPPKTADPSRNGMRRPASAKVRTPSAGPLR
eukprot:TRINITY_DN63461_c0_g1_i1.p1 TRINITY_DN63461_c0_g1~~TRINITY_DN63461_c0_g1_i1.p1  ORF type:complete len:2133 (+),score=658.50 TRINITY_DN63461_c0_g1_i1:90-6488(+)